MSHNNSSGDIWLAGAFAAFTVDLIIYPLDTIKTRLQSGAANPPPLTRGLYQGALGVILATLPSSGAFFTVYEGVKHTLSTRNPGSDGGALPQRGLLPQPAIHAAASAAAELVSCAILAPAEVVKQNAQMVDRGRGGSAGAGASATVQTLRRFRGNPLGLWRGYAALAGRNLPLTALQFPLFERFKEALKARRDAAGTRTGSLLESGAITCVSAGAAGSLAAVVTTPVDVIKTRVMLAAAAEGERAPGGKGEGAAAAAAGGRPEQRRGAWAIGRGILEEQGVRGLFRGGALRAVWTFMGAGLYLGAYETGRVYLARRRGLDINEDDIF